MAGDGERSTRGKSVPPSNKNKQDASVITTVRNQSPAPVSGGGAAAVAATARAPANQTTLQNLSQTPPPVDASNTGSINQDIMDMYNKDILEHLHTQFQSLAEQMTLFSLST